MERLCDEVLQLIFYELSDPGPLTQTSRRLYRISQDPYVRAHYFLIHYGSTEAIYYALGRGKVLTARVLDILLTSGAHFSRYLVQIAIHHYFHTQSHFIKTAWVRSVSLKVFTHFLTRAEETYGEIPRGKGEDDGSVFSAFLKQSRFPIQMKSVTWETVKELMETYRFIPFCARDPIMAQFPLALAVEPKLLPYATANGFSMDYKYRDFVFRKMFERPTLSNEITSDDIANTVRELLKLDSTMFVSRTVAAEVCMEAKMNDIGYAALKKLDKSGHLKFELSTLVEDLLKTFLTTRSISSTANGETLLHLFNDFPSSDVSVRLVVLLVLFISAELSHSSVATVCTKVENLGIAPITRKDVFNVLISPFTERYNVLLDYARHEAFLKGKKGLPQTEIEALVKDVAIRSLEIGCKGKLLRRLCEEFAFLDDIIKDTVLRNHQISIDELPSWEDHNDYHVHTALARDYLLFGLGTIHTPKSLKADDDEDMDTNDSDVWDECCQESHPHRPSPLGEISQETLTTMIRHDEGAPMRSRRRHLFLYGPSDSSGKLRYPHESLQVGKWVKSHFGTKSAVTAAFMAHAVVNHNCTLLHNYLMHSDPVDIAVQVPVTLKLFQILARLGRAPNFYLYHNIEHGAPFYLDENEYITTRVKVEPPHTPLQSSPSPVGKRKRPRRSAATTVASYAVPDSDDEAILPEEDSFMNSCKDKKKQDRTETNLQLWIKHLNELLRLENKKYAERRKRLEKMAAPGEKIRQYKNDFVKSLTSNLRALRKLEAEKCQDTGSDNLVESYSDDEDEYVSKSMKKRKIVSD